MIQEQVRLGEWRTAVRGDIRRRVSDSWGERLSQTSTGECCLCLGEYCHGLDSDRQAHAI